MPQDHSAEVNRLLTEASALLDDWVADLESVDGTTSVHDRAVLVRESVREALNRMRDLDDAIARQQHP